MEKVSEGEKVSGTVLSFSGPSVRTKGHLQAEPPHHFVRPRRFTKGTATMHRFSERRQLLFRLGGIHQLQPALGTLQRPGCQP